MFRKNEYSRGAFEDASHVTRMGIYDQNLRARNEFKSQKPEKITENWFQGAKRKFERIVPALRKRVMANALAGFVMIGYAGAAVMPEKKAEPNNKKANPELVKDKIGKGIAESPALIKKVFAGITGKRWHYDGGILLQQFGKKQEDNYGKDQSKESPRGHAKKFDKDLEATRVEFAGSAEQAVAALDITMKEELRPIFENILWASEAKHAADHPGFKKEHPELLGVTIVGRASAEGRTGVATNKREVETDNIALGYMRAATEAFSFRDQMQKMNLVDLYTAMTADNGVAKSLHFTPEKINEISKQLGKTPEEVNDILKHIKLESEAMILEAGEQMDAFQAALPAFGIAGSGKPAFLELAKQVNDIALAGETDPRLKDPVVKGHYEKVLKILKSQRSTVLRVDYKLGVHKTRDIALPLWLLLPAGAGLYWLRRRRQRKEDPDFDKDDYEKGLGKRLEPIDGGRLPRQTLPEKVGNKGGTTEFGGKTLGELKESVKVEMGKEEFDNSIVSACDRLLLDMEISARREEIMRIVQKVAEKLDTFPKAAKFGIGGKELESFIFKEIVAYRSKFGFAQDQGSVKAEFSSMSGNWEEKRAELLQAYEVQKRLVKNLDEKSYLQSEQVEKANLNSQLEQERRYLRQIEEAIDTKNANFVLRRGDAKASGGLKSEYEAQKKLYKDLDEQYRLASEKLEKAKLYSESRVAHSKLLELEEKLDKDFGGQSSEVKFNINDRRRFASENESVNIKLKQEVNNTFTPEQVRQIYAETLVVQYGLVYEYRKLTPELKTHNNLASLLEMMKNKAILEKLILDEQETSSIIDSSSVGSVEDANRTTSLGQKQDLEKFPRQVSKTFKDLFDPDSAIAQFSSNSKLVRNQSGDLEVKLRAGGAQVGRAPARATGAEWQRVDSRF